MVDICKMISTGMTELQSVDDLEYLIDALRLDLSDEKASEHFRDLFWKTLNSKSAQLNFFVHNVAHRKKV